MAIKDVFSKGVLKVKNTDKKAKEDILLHNVHEAKRKAESKIKVGADYTESCYRDDLEHKVFYMLREINPEYKKLLIKNDNYYESLGPTSLRYVPIDMLEKVYLICLNSMLQKMPKMPPFEEEADFYTFIKKYGSLIAMPRDAYGARYCGVGEDSEAEEDIIYTRTHLAFRILPKDTWSWWNMEPTEWLWPNEVRVLVDGNVDSDFLMKHVNDKKLRKELYDKESEFYSDVFKHLKKDVATLCAKIDKDKIMMGFDELLLDGVAYEKKQKNEALMESFKAGQKVKGEM